MSEDKQYPSYNINVGVATEIQSLIELTTYKYHPYGLEGFRQDLINHIDEWQGKGLSWNGYDQLTHAWRTPWDTHIRYDQLMSPIVETVLGVIGNHAPDQEWFLKDCWISEYVQNSGANRHNHGDNSLGWSFCYYVKVPDTGPGFTLCDIVKNSNYQLNVAEGDLLIFRHPLHHQVFPATDRRVIISGNIHDSIFTEYYLMKNYQNSEFMQQKNLADLQDNEVNKDNWNSSVCTQKYGINLDGGY